ncbi:IS3 family transposase [Xylanimonas allomyrinae]|uniref:IS3 family transposase n=1 Tax=Xylanimonas allomyrinae TaxID=2509459 RepID=A0A4P6EJS7_9MICO|nr:IS3 family transposase [Xylanimonas allomyrinae]QAY62804.1 IS3 family transposase [Xylanimonas allomyrinae]
MKAQVTAWKTETVDELAPLVGVVRACALVGRSRATHHRHANPKPRMHGPRLKQYQPAELTPAERDRVLAVLNSDRYANLAVAQVWAMELDEGRYYCSARTMYRILSAAAMNRERRRQATHPPRVVPELVATGVGEVWSWDITRLRGPAKGVWYHAYVVIDIFSRYIVGWRIETVEDGDLAAELVQDIVTEQGHPPRYLHADGGAAMTSKPLASLLVDLDVRRSHNRPRTSNDNPYSEAQFKTMKYDPHYPARFASIGHARAWMDEFITWYNHEHRHSGIGLLTPASVHHGTAEQIRVARQATLDQAYTAHPERFHRRPVPPELPARVTTNDPERQRLPA